MSSKSMRSCTFCSRTNLSREHLWPDWAYDLIPKSEMGLEAGYFHLIEGKEPVCEKFDKRQGSITRKTLKVVCEQCNNGWMSRMEESCKPLLIPLITGQPLTIDPDKRAKIARWVAMKLLVSEQDLGDGEAITPRHLREEFAVGGAIPSFMRIWIARCGKGDWAHSWHKEVSHIRPPAEGKAAVESGTVTGKNTITVVAGIGDLLIGSIYSTTMHDIDFIVPPHWERRVVRLWPEVRRNTLWPLPLIHGSEANLLVESATRIHRNRPWIFDPATQVPLANSG